LSINCYHHIYLTYTVHSFANLIYHNSAPSERRGVGVAERFWGKIFMYAWGYHTGFENYASDIIWIL